MSADTVILGNMIIITDTHFLPEEANIINGLFEHGLNSLHIRKPYATISDMDQIIKKIDEKYHPHIMIHSHYELIQKYRLKGIHFTEKEKNQIPLYNTINCFKSTSIHSLEALMEVPLMINYVFLSPIFSSVSKQGYEMKWNFHELKRLLNEKHEFKVVALGGITSHNMAQVKELGFDDYAVLGSIWEPYKNGAKKSEVIELFKHLKNEF